MSKVMQHFRSRGLSLPIRINHTPDLLRFTRKLVRYRAFLRRIIWLFLMRPTLCNEGFLFKNNLGCQEGWKPHEIGILETENRILFFNSSLCLDISSGEYSACHYVWVCYTQMRKAMLPVHPLVCQWGTARGRQSILLSSEKACAHISLMSKKTCARNLRRYYALRNRFSPRFY